MIPSLKKNNATAQPNANSLSLLVALNRETVLGRLRMELQQRLGPGSPIPSYDLLGDAVGEKPRTIKGWCLGEFAPCVFKFLRLLGYFGPELTNSFLRLIGQDGAHRIDSPASNDLIVLSAAANYMSITSAAMADGHIDHQERARIIKGAREAHARFGELLASFDSEQRGAK